MSLNKTLSDLRQAYLEREAEKIDQRCRDNDLSVGKYRWYRPETRRTCRANTRSEARARLGGFVTKISE